MIVRPQRRGRFEDKLDRRITLHGDRGENYGDSVLN